MKYHVVLNACMSDYESQAREMYGFIREYCSNPEMIPGDTIIIGQDNQDKKTLITKAVTASVLLIVVNKYQPEVILRILEDQMNRYDLYLFASNYAGNELAVRAAKRMDGSSLVGGMDLQVKEDSILVSKMVYSNHMKGKFQLNDFPCCISVARGIWDELVTENVVEMDNVQIVAMGQSMEADHVIQTEFKNVEKLQGLEGSSLVFVAGRGLQKKENIIELGQIAQELQGELGVSRPAAMNAWTSMERLVGVSGAMIKPEICIAVGVSGAPAFYAGIEKSKFIVAINTDESAAIVKTADVAIIDDGMEVIRELKQCIKRGAKA